MNIHSIHTFLENAIPNESMLDWIFNRLTKQIEASIVTL